MNYDLFKQLIENSPVSISYICEQIGLKRPTFYFQLKNKTLSVDNFLAICKIINLSKDEIMKILQLNN